MTSEKIAIFLRGFVKSPTQKTPLNCTLFPAIARRHISVSLRINSNVSSQEEI